MMIAKVRPRCSLPISSRMKGNFWIVEMMIFLPCSMNCRRSPDRSAMCHRGGHLGILSDRIADLPVEDSAVGDDNDGVEDGLVGPFQRDQLMGEPSYREALATARRMLDQVALPRPVPAGVRQESAHDVELLVPRPDLDFLFLSRLGVLGGQYLGEVLDDVGHALRCEDVDSTGTPS